MRSYFRDCNQSSMVKPLPFILELESSDEKKPWCLKMFSCIIVGSCQEPPMRVHHLSIRVNIYYRSVNWTMLQWKAIN